MNEHELKEHIRTVRKHVLKMVYDSGASHVGTSLSCADIMACIYEVAQVNPKDPRNEDRDRVILSKGHGVATWYAVLAERGFFDKKLLDTFYADASPLTGHPDIQAVPGIETTTGSLGHGLPVGLGMALAAQVDKKAYRVFVVLGDGECDEGTIWEAALAARQFKLHNLTVVIDRNDQQGLGKTTDIIDLEPFAAKWKSFGWHVLEVDGHNHDELLVGLKTQGEKPVVMIATTTKGKGVSFMEHDTFWHYHNPDDEEYKKALAELDK